MSPRQDDRRPLSERTDFAARVWIVWAVAVAFVVDPTPALAQTTSTWNGTSGNWSTATIWSTNPLAPNNGNGGANYNAVVSGSGTLTLDTAVTIEQLTFSNGTITGSNDLTINTGMTWSGGTLSGSGATTVGGTSTWGGGNLTLNRKLTLTGNATWSGANQFFSFGSSGLLTVASGGTFTDATTSTSNQMLASAGAQFAIASGGTYAKTGTGTTSIAAAFNNSGTTSIQSGTLKLNGGGSATNGSFAIASGANLTFTAGSYTADAGTSFTGSGTVGTSNNPGTIAVSGPFANTLSLSVTAGTFNFNGSPNAVNNVTVSGIGTLGGTANVAVSGTFTWSNGGTLTGAGATTTVAGTTSIDTTGFLGRNLTLNGNATWTGSTSLNRISFSVGSGATLTVGNGSTFTDATTGTSSIKTQTGIVTGLTVAISAGSSFVKTGTGDTSVAMAFNNAGSVQVNAGTLSLGNGGAVGGGSFAIGSGAALSLSGGTFTTNASTSFTGSGTLNVDGGTISVTGPFSNTLSVGVSDGALNFNGSAVSLVSPVVSGGSLGGSANVTMTGGLTWSDGTMDGTGTTTVTGASLIGGGIPTLNRNLTLNGNATWAGADQLFVFGSTGVAATLTVGSGTTFTDATTGSINEYLSSNSPSIFAIAAGGTYAKTGPAITDIAAAFNSSGTTSVQSGTLRLSGGGAATGGTFAVASGATLLFYVGSYTADSTTTFTGSGTVGTSNNPGTIDVSGPFANTLSLSITAGTFNFNGSPKTVKDLTVSDIGTMGGTANVAVSGTFTWSNGGTLTGAGATTTVAGATSLDTTGFLGRNLILNGNATWTGSSLNQIGFAESSGATLTIGNGATFTDATTGTSRFKTLTGIVTGLSVAVAAGGTYVKTGSGTTSVAMAFNNAGAVQVNAGTLSLGGGGTATAGSTFVVAPGASLLFSGGVFTGVTTITGALAVNGASSLTAGTVSVSGNTTISNTFTITSGSNFGGGGNVSVTSSGILVVNGTATRPVTSSGVVMGGGTINNNVNIQTGGFLRPGNSPGTITLGGGLTLDGDYDWDLNGNSNETTLSGSMYDRATIDGTATVNASTAHVNVKLGPAVDFTNAFWNQQRKWNILDSGSLTSATLPPVTVSSTSYTASYPSGAFSLEIGAGTRILVVWNPVPPLSSTFWNGQLGNGVWAASNGTASNWQSTSGAPTGQPVLPASGIVYTFSGIGALPASMTLGQDFSILGLAITSANTAPFTLASDGFTLTLGTSGISVANGAGAVNIAANLALNGNQTWSNASTTNLLTISGTIGGSGALTTSGNVAIAGTLGNRITAFTVLGNRTVTLTGANSYTGTTNLGGGSIVLGSDEAPGISGPLGNGGPINFSGGTLTYSSANQFDYSPRFGTSANQAYAVDTNGQNVTWATPLVSSGGSLTKSGTGTLILAGANAYSGPTTLNNGALTVAATGSIGTGPLFVNNTNTTGTPTQSLLSLFNAAQTVSLLSGTVTNAAGGNSSAIDLNTGTTLTVNQATSSTFSGSIYGGGNLTVNVTGAGNSLTLSGFNTFTGNTNIQAGRLVLSNSLAGPGAAINISPGATLVASGTLQRPVVAVGDDRTAVITANGPLSLVGLTTPVDFKGTLNIGANAVSVISNGTTSFLKYITLNASGSLGSSNGLTFRSLTGSANPGIIANGNTTIDGNVSLGQSGIEDARTYIQVADGAVLRFSGVVKGNVTQVLVPGFNGTIQFDGLRKSGFSPGFSAYGNQTYGDNAYYFWGTTPASTGTRSSTPYFSNDLIDGTSANPAIGTLPGSGTFTIYFNDSTTNPANQYIPKGGDSFRFIRAGVNGFINNDKGFGGITGSGSITNPSQISFVGGTNNYGLTGVAGATFNETLATLNLIATLNVVDGRSGYAEIRLADQFVWKNGLNNGTLDVAGNWELNQIPGINAIATSNNAPIFDSRVTNYNGGIVNFAGSRTLGGFKLAGSGQGSGGYTLGGAPGATLTLFRTAADGGNLAVVNVLSGTHAVTLPVMLGSNALVTTAAGSQVTFSGGLSGTAKTLYKNGPGTLVLTGINDLNGGTNVVAGTLKGSGSLGSSVTVSSGATLAAGTGSGSSARTFTTGAVTFHSGSNFQTQLFSTMGNDMGSLTSVGPVTFADNTVRFKLDLTGITRTELLSAGTTFTVISAINGGVNIGTGNLDSSNIDLVNNAGGFTQSDWLLVQNPDNVQLVFSAAAIPEPVTILGLAVAGLGLAGWTRRRTPEA